MTLDAPSHLETRDTRHDVHGFHGTVAARARDARLVVRFMAETYESRKLVHLHPSNGRTVLPIARELFNVGMFPQRDLMASHTPLYGRNARKPGVPRRAVAICAVNSVVNHVHAVAESNGLFRSVRTFGEGPHLGSSDDRHEGHGGDRN